jgi:hypothetical protein
MESDRETTAGAFQRFEDGDIVTSGAAEQSHGGKLTAVSKESSDRLRSEVTRLHRGDGMQEVDGAA